MSACVFAFILTLSALSRATVESGFVSTPTNVTLTSYNMNLVLRWSPPEGAASNLLYSTEYKTSVTDYSVGFVNISALECDFTRLSHLFISEHGKYSGRVRAQVGSETSAWVESNSITLDKDTIIGSPNVSVISSGATIEVSIKDPVFAISALRNVYIYATYNITYWKHSQPEKARHISKVRQNPLVLNDLDPWTKYCVQVQINTERNPIPSKPSGIVCERTTNEEEADWVPALVTLIFSVAAMALVVIVVVYRKSISNILCPKDALPQHFKEYLLTPHKVSIITDDTSEDGSPLEATKMTCSKQLDVTVSVDDRTRDLTASEEQ
ncbi:interleukin-10 receptor subunit beta-like [Solea solea]|uniref:interleukin-10 receptor subunit beta-like n=1 Tax=Solea solea TaxID=90069 RepID=UPI00272D1A48|nr:interleukin-10 receptor subunit beta-like [Solea solea]